ncbi:MAG: hypothetical protein PHF00_09140, partial [Elusimicrobia bacterium]|nr:hypothetical protein [Elusimicrobiota bacterium]
MKALASILLLAVLPGRVLAGNYILQSSFTPATASLTALDRDAVGNLYVFGLPTGGTYYTVASYATQGITPMFSFDSGVSSPAAFAVEHSGIVDVLDGAGGLNSLALRRFQNNGVFLGQTSISLPNPYGEIGWVSSAINKANGHVYIGHQYVTRTYCPLCVGCSCPPGGLKGFINEYDLSGALVRTVTMPGISATGGSCYTPSHLAVDPQGSLYVADSLCQHVLKFSAGGSLQSDIPSSNWTYSFYPRGMWTDPAGGLYISQPVCGPAGCPQGVVKLGGDGTLQASVVADSPGGCAWNERILYLGSSGSQPLRRFVYTGTPTVPAQSGPLGMVVQHSSAASLSWQSSSDPDGDPVAYSILMGTSSTGLAVVGTSAQNSLATPPLAFGATYYWQVAATDSHLGLPLQTTPSPVMSFNLNLSNSAPGSFSVAGGTGPAVTRATSAILAWQAAVDADNDPVVYDVFWRPAGQSTQTLAASTDQTSWRVDGLAFGTTYYWSVRARDSYDASRWLAGGTEQFYVPIFKNSPPAAPAVLAGAGTSSQHTWTPRAELAWSWADDPDGDPVNYRVFVGTAPAALALVQDGEGASYGFTSPATETTYYWEVSAYDSYGAAADSPIQALRLTLLNSAPLPFAVLSGSGTVATRDSSLALSWQAADDPDGDPVAYDVAVATFPGAGPIIQSSPARYFDLLFEFGTTYYWRVTARDGFGGAASSGLQAVLPVFQNSAPGAPANRSQTGAVPHHGFAPEHSFYWDDAVDPDGDALAYSIQFGTDPARLTTVSPVSLGYTVPLSLNTTYYYKIIATDVYGKVSPSPFNSVFYRFANVPPQAFSVAGGTGTVITRDAATAISWTTSADPDGDMVGYRVSLGTAPASLSAVEDTALPAAVLTDLGFGTTYYWRVDAYDGFGGTTAISQGAQRLLRLFKNSPPAAPVNLSKTGTNAFHGTAPSQSFFWQEAVDPDGDPVLYNILLGTSPASLAPAPSNSLGYTASNLSVDTAYYYKISAVDGYGAVSNSPTNWVYYQFANAPPQAFDAVSGFGAVSTRSGTDSLSWTAAADPDDDPVGYRVFLGTSQASLALLADARQTSVPVGPLAFGATYYWRTEAYDAFGATATVTGGVQALVHVFKNSAPASVVYLSTAGVLNLHTASPAATLHWAASADPDGDPVAYELELSTGTGFSTIALGSATALLVSLQFETACQWRVLAADPYGGVSTGSWMSLVSHMANLPPKAVQYLSPAALRTRATSYPLSWGDTGDPDGDDVVYRFELGTSSAALASVQTGTTTAFLLPLQYGTTVFYRVSAEDSFGATTAGEVRSLFAEFLNDPPETPSVAGPFKSSPVVRTMKNSVSVSWDQVGNPPGDPLTYTVYFGEAASAM